MLKSESINELAAALVKAQAAMTFAKKDSANPFFKSKYADLSAVVEAIKKPLADNGLAYTQATDIDEHGGVIIETTLMHTSGQWIESRLRMVPVKADPQGIGSCITYGRRYGLQALVGLPADDDDGNAASGNNPNGTKRGTGVHKPSDGAMESLSAARQQVIADLAVLVNDAMHISAEDAFIVIDEADLDHDEKVALWSLLDSKTRSAIKKITEARKAELVSQP